MAAVTICSDFGAPKDVLSVFSSFVITSVFYLIVKLIPKYFTVVNAMASGPIISWQIDGKTMETVTDFIFRGLQNHCRW